MNKRSLFVNISVLCITALLLIMVCSAWYSENKTATVNGVNGSTADSVTEVSYYLGTEGSDDYSENSKNFWESIFGKKESKKEYTNSKGAKVSLNTTESSSLIGWNLSSDSNIGNFDSENEIVEGIQPSSFGTLSFYIIPTKNTSLFKASFSFDLSGYQSRNGKTFKKITGNDLIYMDYVNSHLLFFDSCEDGIYSGWINKNDLTVTIENAQKDIAYKVTIYWAWPSVLSQVLLKNGNYYLYGRNCIVNENTQNEIIGNMKTNSNKWFNDKNNELSDLISVIDSMNVDRVTGSFPVDEYKKLNTAYNEIDQLIGQNVDYLEIDMKAVGVKNGN